jgi:hypothetical protein
VLVASILQMLGVHPAKAEENPGTGNSPGQSFVSILDEQKTVSNPQDMTEPGSTDAAGLLRPLFADPPPAPLETDPRFEEMVKVVNKVEKPVPKKILDIFE